MAQVTVFLVQHEYEDQSGSTDTKLVGVYSTESNAASAIERLKSRPGFRDNPDGFTVAHYEIDKDHWIEGFVRV